jgi:acyl-CoA reductase-like NAD-dependent aldehyde dehydrogenase
MNHSALNMVAETGWDMTIGGNAVPGSRHLPVYDPVSGDVFAQAPDATIAETDAAIAAAAAAFPAWAALSWDERAARVREFGAAIREDNSNLARLLCREQGKPLEKAISEIGAGLAYLESYCAMRLEPEVFKDTATQRIELHHRPLGVVGAITAWNYPLLLAIWKIAPALVAGNTVVVKPAPSTPLATLALGRIAARVLPPGVVNVVSGATEAGERLTQHPTVRKITFTGSTETGKRIMANASARLKRLTLELGGNDAGIVLEDADPKAIAADIFWAKFSNCGQVCAALKRLYVHRSIFEQLCTALSEVAAQVKIGPGLSAGVQIGPMQNRAQRDRMVETVAASIAAGARLIYQSEIPAGGGYFYPITLLAEAPEDSPVVRSETFGPVLAILPYDDVEDAIRRANDTEYGLGASVWSPDTARATAIAQRLEAGSTWVNQHPSMDPNVPFGGIKSSGLGVEGGLRGLEEFTSIQVVNVKKQ